MRSDHRCSDDCRICQARAERRADRGFEACSDEDYYTQQSERRYERYLYGRDA